MKKILIIAIIILNTDIVFSQQEECKDRFNIKLNYGNVNSRLIIPVFTNQNIFLQETIFEKKPHFSMEGTYKLNRLWEVGVFLGYSKGTFISSVILNSEPGNFRSALDQFGSSIDYGLKTNFQLLPLLFNAENLRIKVYIPFQMGLVSQYIKTEKTGVTKWDLPVFEIGAGAGINYYFTKNIGIYGEYLPGQYNYNRNFQLKAGIVLNF